MGFFKGVERIGTLSHAAGVISLASSRITIGGQQYDTSTLSRTISTDVTLAANTLYMIYAVLVAGVVQLRISTNLNSVGPAGFTTWKLVGAFYSNGGTYAAPSVFALGDFVNINNKPATGWITTALSIVDSLNANIMSASPSNAIMRWRRDGGQNYIEFTYYHTATVGSAGTGPYSAKHPVNIPAADSGAMAQGAGNTPNIGIFALDVGGTNSFRRGSPQSLQSDRVNLAVLDSDFTQQVVSSTFRPASVANTAYTGRYDYPVSSWSNTPLKDL